MYNIYSPAFDKVRQWIRDARDNGWSWQDIKTMRKPDGEEFENQLKFMQENVFFTTFSFSDWLEIVDALKDTEEREQSLIEDSALVTDKTEDNGLSVPDDKRSSWELYKAHLRESKWNEESIKEIEQSTLKILRRLNYAQGSEIVKGLVVGHVQSGKTANMAALMAMAADWGWNLFIVLSGTIENLRKQTQDRLYRDLNRPGNIEWIELTHPSLRSFIGEKLQNLQLEPVSRRRYFTVCLKNSKRLEDLIKWLQSDENKLAQLRIIVIDDEADQGGINTANISVNERSKINKLIVNLVEGNNPDGKPLSVRPHCMNYIGYTATPYANFLNESASDSLYPKNFIRTLKPSNEYIGAKQIFGIEGTENCDGMNIVRDVPPKDLELMRRLHKDETVDLPQSLKDALLWFLCAAAAMRKFGYSRKSISMLVHTSQKQKHHTNVANAISKWLTISDPEELLEYCRNVWEREAKSFTKKDFFNSMPDYSKNNEINDYPEFDEIESEIAKLLSRVDHIPLNEDGLLEYHQGIHLCIDNCSYNYSRDEDVYVRLAYPDPSSNNYPEPAPAFIVVGGSTLSRGLTIEGLVSTFFLRAANQADSLMQMGRWFGYRRGYELYPRIWMTEETKSKFVFLALLEHELREDLRRYMEAGVDPIDVGPRILESPKVSWLRITSRNKMQNAIATDIDYSGTNVQTVVFSEDSDFLEQNIRVADEFLMSLGNGTPSYSRDSIVWRGVAFEVIKNGLLRRMNFHPNALTFNQIDSFCDWYEQSAEEAGYTDWNIVTAGTKVREGEEGWKVPGGVVGKIYRTRKSRSRKDRSLNIGVLRAPKDLFEDIDPRFKEFLNQQEISKAAAIEKVRRLRKQAGLGKTPQLIMYRIDKDSEPRKSESNREKLAVPHDIIGISIWIPEVTSKSLKKYLTVKITADQYDIDDETGDSSNDED